MHADYFSPGHARIRIFSNHIEFYNPGGLPKSVEELKAKDLSLPRSPIITKLFRMVKLAENVGFALDKIESNWELYNQTTPEILREFDSTVMKLAIKDTDRDTDTWGEKWRERWGEISESQKMILKEIDLNPNTTTAGLAAIVGINQRNIKKNIDILKEKEIIQRIGPAKGGYWKIMK